MNQESPTFRRWECQMGDDGKYTMYIDMVNNEFAKNSMSDKRYKLMDNVEDMFDIVRKS